ncbi:hypothetical protein [Gallaecimonas sp. GXIMD4217]|uniref:hypothetical protein n=1 Tax=Gallaecimonas sp. GXIMD4217 TaxID=3131927 RepID=UPI00311B412C
MADDFGGFGNKKQALAQLLPVLDAVLESHESGDYDAFCRHVSDDFRRRVSREAFARAHRQVQPGLGRLLGKRYLGMVRRPRGPLLLFAGNYEHGEGEVLIQALFADPGPPARLDWLWIE